MKEITYLYSSRNYDVECRVPIILFRGRVGLDAPVQARKNKISIGQLYETKACVKLEVWLTTKSRSAFAFARRQRKRKQLRKRWLGLVELVEPGRRTEGMKHQCSIRFGLGGVNRWTKSRQTTQSYSCSKLLQCG